PENMTLWSVRKPPTSKRKSRPSRRCEYRRFVLLAAHLSFHQTFRIHGSSDSRESGSTCPTKRRASVVRQSCRQSYSHSVGQASKLGRYPLRQHTLRTVHRQDNGSVHVEFPWQSTRLKIPARVSPAKNQLSSLLVAKRYSHWQ